MLIDVEQIGFSGTNRKRSRCEITPPQVPHSGRSDSRAIGTEAGERVNKRRADGWEDKQTDARSLTDGGTNGNTGGWTDQQNARLGGPRRWGWWWCGGGGWIPLMECY